MVSSEMWRWQKHRWMSACFAFVSGYADIISFVRYHCFASMMTGNTILMARFFGSRYNGTYEGYGSEYYLLIIFAFLMGVVLHRAAEVYHPNRGGSIVGIPWGVMMTALELVFWFKGDALVFHPYFKYSVAAVAPMFGVVSSACATGRLGTATTMVTGHILSLGNMLVKALLVSWPTYEEKMKACQSVTIIVCTILGVIVGNNLRLAVGHNCHGLFLPVGPLLALLLWAHDHLARPRSLVKRLQQRQRRKAAAAAAAAKGQAGNNVSNESGDVESAADTDSIDDEGVTIEEEEEEDDEADLEGSNQSQAQARDCLP